MNPAVSILMPVYNGAAYLSKSLESMLQQTYDDFELIVIDDGSSDRSAEIIQRVKDRRLRFYRQTNHGLAATLNRAIQLSRGSYLARQDQDDVSLPLRLMKQVRYLEEHLRCGLVGTWAEIVAGTEPTGRVHRHASENGSLQFDLLFDNPFVHSSVMMRKTAIESVGTYSTDPARQPPEDYELWSRLARQWEVANIPEVLHIYRELPSSMSRDGSYPFRDRVIDISAENIRWILGEAAGMPAVDDLAALNHAAYARVDPCVRWKHLSRVMTSAADRLAVSCHADPATIQRKAYAQLLEIRPHYRRFKNAHGVRRTIRDWSAAFGRMVSGW
jgi:hypothetical protein